MFKEIKRKVMNTIIDSNLNFSPTLLNVELLFSKNLIKYANPPVFWPPIHPLFQLQKSRHLPICPKKSLVCIL